MTANLKFRSPSNVRLPDSSLGSLWLSDLNDQVLSRCRDNLNLPCSGCSLYNPMGQPHRLILLIIQRHIILTSGFELYQA